MLRLTLQLLHGEPACMCVACLFCVSDTNACVFLLGEPWTDMDGLLGSWFFLACFGRSLVLAGTLLTILDFLVGKG